MTGRKKGRGIVAAVTAAILSVIIIVANIVVVIVFDGLATQYFGKIGGGGSKDSVYTYYESDFESADQLAEYEKKLSAQIGAEGSVLLKNEENVLPLKEGKALSIFGTASANLLSGGSGSGAGTRELNMDMKTALENSGLAVNEKLWDFYVNGAGSDYKRGEGSINYGASFDWSINECPVSVIKSESGLTDTFSGTTAVYIISRTGGEDGDPTRDMAAYGGKAGTHYLELDDTEKELVSYLNETFEDVIVIVNSSNAMELGWVNEYDNIKALISAPALGRSGVEGLAQAMAGSNGEEEISFSGGLVDTFVYDNYSSPAMQNMGDFNYVGTDHNYLSYSEGIYVGYRYYETRYEDVVMGTQNVGSYDYDKTVLYPFGYGLSYTEFEWSDFKVSEPDKDGTITAEVTVKNVGEYNGKEVVQLYFQSPYTSYDKENEIEKSAVELCGYGKTSNLEPGKQETVEITMNLSDFRTYDAKTAKTYILDAGNYYITAARDAHKAVDQILAAKGFETEGNADLTAVYEQKEQDTKTYAVDTQTGTAITNQFDDARMEGVTYLSRSNWSMMDQNGLRVGTATTQENPMEQNGVSFGMEDTQQVVAALDAKESNNPDTETKINDLSRSEEETETEIVDMRGLDYDDPAWDTLLEQLTLDEVRRIVFVNGYSALGDLESVNKPSSNENDGPAGLNDLQKHENLTKGDFTSMNWPGEIMLASTWNVELAQDMGHCIGEEGLLVGDTGWYAPAMNIHRTPFAGRNYEYYSEDPYLSGTMGYAEVNGASEKGMICYIKHFALNDQETNRTAVATWANEQSIREIYLEPFEMTIKNNKVTEKYLDEEGNMAEKEINAANAVMTSYNSIGTTWAGGNYNLLTNVLRAEWGFDGIVLTDYNGGQEYMDTTQMLYAGGNTKLRTMDKGFTVAELKKSPSLLSYAYESAHRYLFVQANSNVINGIAKGSTVGGGIPVYYLLLGALDLVTGVIVIFLLRSFFKKRKAV